MCLRTQELIGICTAVVVAMFAGPLDQMHPEYNVMPLLTWAVGHLPLRETRVAYGGRWPLQINHYFWTGEWLTVQYQTG